MAGLQVWVSSALNDDEVGKALVLCYSLRRFYTSRKIAVIASPKLSENLKHTLNLGFDLVFYLDESQNRTSLCSKDFVKLYSILSLKSFDCCVYVSPFMLALKNCDDIFSQQFDGVSMVEGDHELSTFLFKSQPGLSLMGELDAGLRGFDMKELGNSLKDWIKHSFQYAESLPEKFNIVLRPGYPLLGYEENLCMANLVNYPNLSDIEILAENHGLLEKLVADHWLKIYNKDVLPTIQKLSPQKSIYSMEGNSVHKDSIAIVGMSCRYPGSNNLEEFWNMLLDGQDGTCSPPPFRWLGENRSLFSKEMKRCRETNAGFLKVPVDEFDAKFFGISPLEALVMDPQHRILHELTWEALEDACINPTTLRGTSGSVFMGSWTNDYKDILVSHGGSDFFRAYMGNSIGAATARLSFMLGMTGPSIATESGCSSAMVALHLACRSLLNGETNVGICGGVNLLLHPFDKELMPMIFSADGHCKTFSEDANGFARAEGCGVLILKRVSDAVKDGDRIWAVIRGSAISQEGLSSSMGTPTVHSETIAMKDALRNAKVTPEQVSFVEAHGTGTIVGDPLEIAAIANSYHSPARVKPLIIGSVKANVGHTESCSGITGIMKVALAMHHEKIPRHRNFTRLNPAINLEAVPAVIPMETVEWRRGSGERRIAGVNSFGITGTDAHVVLEEPLEEMGNVLRVAYDRPLHLLKVSAKSREALEMVLESYLNYMENSTEGLRDIAYSSNVGKADFEWRAVVIGKDREEAGGMIRNGRYLKGDGGKFLERKICFLFTGQGCQYTGMGKGLYEFSPVFKMHFDQCTDLIEEKYGINVKGVIWGEGDTDIINRTIYSQISIFCVEYALVKLWEGWGVKPDYVISFALYRHLPVALFRQVYKKKMSSS